MQASASLRLSEASVAKGFPFSSRSKTTKAGFNCVRKSQIRVIKKDEEGKITEESG